MCSMTVITVLLAIGGFVIVLLMSGIVGLSQGVFMKVQQVYAVVHDNRLSDYQREKELQRISFQLFGIFFLLLVRIALVLLASFLPILASHLLGFADISNVLDFLVRLDVIVVSTSIIIVLYGLFKFSSKKHIRHGINYTIFDRIIHKTAFFSPSTQLFSADVEKRFFSFAYQGVEVKSPIFITSLPRAGTTLFLEIFNHFNSLFTNTYRDMPFVLAPILWSKLSGAFYKREEYRERAHGDGMNIGYDTPEAFEEVFWQIFWPEKYSNRIELWGSDDAKEEASIFFFEQIQKTIAVRRANEMGCCRYLSKNNTNIARLGLVKKMFPDAKILMPVRHPFDHAASLLRQHLNFLKIHKNEPFICRYMADIGHYEFGLLHHPIAFPKLDLLIRDKDPLTIDYWIAYWISAYDFVLERHEDITLISYESFCNDSQRTLSDICTQLDIQEKEPIDVLSSIIRTPRSYRNDDIHCDAELLSRAMKLYRRLFSRDLIQK